MLAEWGLDLVLVPDVIEHLPDPAAFLRRLAQCLPTAEFVVTVPNALALRNAVQAAGGRSVSILTTVLGSRHSPCLRC
ncbi:hypothetical protein LP416_12560 [Polaromonas sp. P2-4]|nr:hypothetical protein LP416_12560 [Polaromonas sp. P2-4]